ncbi:hypothetical protein [Fibrella forsythiae]|uniref:ParB/Sulfiredoxin domain-containing protein n=1 Tax=Fibrella forsythiae TaxID=2817061 RepID=A0ABS3JSX1_9BACT|nr:hypothetical protein [Fibrella forsythiae]MBO0953115.1 hypothetical protein [Fibrella forsythiae]
MERDLRVRYFEDLSKKPSNYTMELWYKDSIKKLDVYDIDLNYLVYNQYNGRIASYVSSFEKQEGRNLDPTKEEDIKIIEGFLKNSNVESNRSTKRDLIDKKGQLKYGIVTKDGVIIDGNRRAMLLKEIGKENKSNPIYFKAVLLDVFLDENPAEIMRLETTYQMGEDAKVDYNAIEKYLKCQSLLSHFSSEEIARMMAEPVPKINEYVSIMKLMDEYLDSIDSSGIYTRLDKTEGIFVDLNNYLNRYKTEKSKIPQWRYTDSDLNDLKLIYFDYIRTTYNRTKDNGESGVLGSGDSKDYRFIGQTSKKGSFFCDQKIWESFRDEHFKKIDPIREIFTDGDWSVSKQREDNPDMKLDGILKNRDETWSIKTSSILKKNLGLSKSSLENKNQNNEPVELLKKAINALDAIDTSGSAFLKDENVSTLLAELNKMTWEYKQMIKSSNK